MHADIQIELSEILAWGPRMEALITTPAYAQEMAKIITGMLGAADLSNSDKRKLYKRRAQAVLKAGALVAAHGGGYYPHHLFEKTAQRTAALTDILSELRMRSVALGVNIVPKPVVSEAADVRASIYLFDFATRLTESLGDMLSAAEPLAARTVDRFSIQIDRRTSLNADGSEKNVPIAILRGERIDLMREYMGLKKDDNIWRTLRRWATDPEACPWRLYPVQDPGGPEGQIVYLPFMEFRVLEAPQREGVLLAERSRAFRLDISIPLIMNNRARMALPDRYQAAAKALSGGRDIFAPGGIETLVQEWKNRLRVMHQNLSDEDRNNAERVRIVQAGIDAIPSELSTAFRKLWDAGSLQGHIDAMLQHGHTSGSKAFTIPELVALGLIKDRHNRTRANVRAVVLANMMNYGIFLPDYAPHYKGNGGRIPVKLSVEVHLQPKEFKGQQVEQVEGIRFQWSAE